MNECSLADRLRNSTPCDRENCRCLNHLAADALESKDAEIASLRAANDELRDIARRSLNVGEVCKREIERLRTQLGIGPEDVLQP